MINANAIGTFFQRKKGKGRGPLPPIPGLDGVIGLYIAKGLTNDSMKENPVWKDKSGQSNDLQMKNFSWNLGSGCGSYVIDQNLWKVNVPYVVLNKTASSVSVINEGGINGLVAYMRNRYWNVTKARKLKVTSSDFTTGEVNINYYVGAGGGEFVELKVNGITEIPANPNFTGAIYLSLPPNKSGSLTIEEIPDYQGAIVFDGVNDYGICETFPILTKEKGYTVMALRRWLTYPLNGSAVLISKRKDASLGAFIMERNISVSEPEVSYTFGQRSGISIDNNNLVTYQTTNYYNDQELQVGNSEDTDTLLLGAGFYNNGLPSGYGNFAVYSVVIIDHDATAEERQKVIDYWKQEYPHLFFDQAWTVTGKTNEDEDRATVKNLTGNGNDLVLSNFTFTEDSGYGRYTWNFNNWNGRNNTKPVLKTSSKANLTGTFSSGNWGFINLKTVGEEIVVKATVKITGLTSELPKMYFGKFDIGDIVKLLELKEGVNVIDTVVSSSWEWYGFGFREAVESCNVIIEQIPDYEGYLVTDGVDDFVASSNFNLYDDFTFVGEWILLSTDVSVNAGIVKDSKLYIYNYTTGISLFINGTGSAANTGLAGIKSLKAVCSDGRVYDENWNEITVKFDVHGRENNPLILGSNANYNRFTSMAFKNGAFYSDRLLTKEQCIAGYNLLQTFKNS